MGGKSGYCLRTRVLNHIESLPISEHIQFFPEVRIFFIFLRSFSASIVFFNLVPISFIKTCVESYCKFRIGFHFALSSLILRQYAKYFSILFDANALKLIPTQFETSNWNRSNLQVGLIFNRFSLSEIGKFFWIDSTCL